MTERMKIPELMAPTQTIDSQLGVYLTPVQPPQQEIVPESPPVPLSHYFWILRRHRWKMLSFVALCVLVTFLVSLRLKPIYESTATVDVDREAPTEVVGQDSSRSTMPSDIDQFLATQVKLIQSDAVLRPVAEQYHLLTTEGQLNTKMSPERMEAIARAPVTLRRVKVTRATNTYLLLISYRSPDPTMASTVANAIANSYLNHSYELRIRSSANLSSFMEKQLDELKAKMERSGLALAQFEKDLDVINPEEKTNILTSRLLQLNTEYTTAQAERVRQQAAYDSLTSGSLAAAQISAQGDALAKLKDSLNQAQQRFALVKSTYGSSHPEYRKALSELNEVEKQYADTRKDVTARVTVQYQEAKDREGMLKQAVAETKAEWDRLNARSFEYQQLKREADTDKTLYEELIRKIRESDINAGFQNNNIRIADVARPPLRQVFPNTRLNLMVAFLFSSLLAVGIALASDALDTTLRDPKEASRFLGVDVIGTLPVDRTTSQTLLGESNARDAIIAAIPPPDEGKRKGYYRSSSDFDESIRTIRNTILLSDFEGRLRSIMLTSASPAEGKSTLASHFAIANADRGKRTLLVDGDLRRPSIHTKFGLPLDVGLSNVLNGDMPWQEVVRPLPGRPNLSLLLSGPGSHRAADLVGPRLSSLLDEFAKEFDLVILDSPPLLGFAECLQMATAADGVLIVSRAGETKRRAVAEVISVLRRIRANLLGVVLNQVTQNTSSDGYSYYGYYGYRYKYK